MNQPPVYLRVRVVETMSVSVRWVARVTGFEEEDHGGWRPGTRQPCYEGLQLLYCLRNKSSKLGRSSEIMVGIYQEKNLFKVILKITAAHFNILKQ